VNNVYDVAVSFASEQRPYVVEVVRECERRGLAVFYDADRALDFWGKNVIRELRDVYGGTQARYFVPFLSPEYLAKPYPMDEFTTALTQALQRQEDYILPVVFTGTQIPINLLNPAIGYLRAEDHTPPELAEKLATKISSTPVPPPPRTVAAMMEQSVRVPRVEMRAYAKDNARVYQAGHDMHITEQ
jgi:hypothetical protein